MKFKKLRKQNSLRSYKILFNKTKSIFEGLEKFVYVFLIIFIVICFSLKLSFIYTILLALVFIFLIFIIYVLQYKYRNKFASKNFDIENINEEDLIEAVKKYYTKLNYTLLEDEKGNLLIEKNYNKYKILFLLKDKFSIKNLQSVKKTRKDIKSLIVITDCELNKEQRRYIKNNNLFIISKMGLINIMNNYWQEIQKNNLKK